MAHWKSRFWTKGLTWVFSGRWYIEMWLESVSYTFYWRWKFLSYFLFYFQVLVVLCFLRPTICSSFCLSPTFIWVSIDTIKGNIPHAKSQYYTSFSNTLLSYGGSLWKQDRSDMYILITVLITRLNFTQLNLHCYPLVDLYFICWIFLYCFLEMCLNEYQDLANSSLVWICMECHIHNYTGLLFNSFYLDLLNH